MKTKLFISVAVIAVLALMAGCGKDPSPCFTFTSVSIDNEDLPIVGEEIEFTNCSSDATSYVWDFGDDSKTSTKENPTHVYESADTYTVTLTATGDGGTKTTTQEIEVMASLTGTWEGTMTVTGATDVYAIVFTIEQSGTELTGTFEFSDGTGTSDFSSGSKLSGQDVTIKFTEPTYQMVFKFTGTVNDAYDEMDGDYTMTMAGGGLTGSWDVTKSSKKSAVNPNGKGIESFLKKL